MKRNMIFKNVMVALAVIAGGTLATSCSDWDDHYDAETAVTGSATATIWENVSSNPQLSQFADLLKKAGYDAVLNSSQTYTVWAPLNGTFNYEQFLNEDADKLLKEFVQNHIARNNYPASGVVDETVHMLNEKVLGFEGSGSYTMGGIAVEQPNVASKNGVIHTLGGMLVFRSNIFESLQAGEFAIDSICNFIHAYDVLKLNESKSIQGPVVDGQITYLDSVFDDYNPLCQTYAWVNREDSNYTMVVPTNEAWNKAIAAITPCYNYIDKYTWIETPSSSTQLQSPETVELPNGAAYWRDSIAHKMLLTGLFFNNNIYDNVKLNNLQTGEALKADSLVNSNYSSILFEEDSKALFEGTTIVKKSNGQIAFTDDSLRLHTWAVWNPLLNYEAEYSSYQASVKDGSLSREHITAGTQNENVPGKVSQSGYISLRASSSTANPEVNFYLPNVRSTTYVFYAVFVPANIVSEYVTDIRPYFFEASVGYTTEKGETRNPQRLGRFSNDPSKVDTVCLGEFTFPICYYGTTGKPYLRLSSRVGGSQNDTYDRNMRIDRIFLVPKDLDDYLKEHPDYKFYYDGMYSGSSATIYF